MGDAVALHRLTDFGETAAVRAGDRSAVLLVLAALSAAVAFLLPIRAVSPLFFGAAAGLLALVLLSFMRTLPGRLLRRRVSPAMRFHMEAMRGVAVLTDANGHFLATNSKGARLGQPPTRDTLNAALARVAVDPGAVVRRLMSSVTESGEAEISVGAPHDGARIQLTRIPRTGYLWHIVSRRLDPDLALISVQGGTAVLNERAEALLGPGSRPAASVFGDIVCQQGGVHRLRHGDGSERPARLIELERTEERSEFALLPTSSLRFDARVDGATALSTPDLLSVLPVPMLKVSETGQLLEANSEARSILAIDSSALPPLFELVEGMGRPIADWLSDAANGRGLLKPEIVRAVIPGQELYLQIALGRTFEDGKVVLVGILNDATELKTLEANFVQSQKMQAIGQLAGGVAHDFNNLLTAISGHCDLLLLRHDASDPDYADLIQISQNANRAASLVGQLLAFSRKQNLKPQALDLRDTMADLAHLLNRLIGERVQLEVTHAPGPQAIRADRRQLEQVIVNLVVNARDAMPGGGKIEVVTRTEFLTEEIERDRATLTPGEYVVIEVRDTGCGIAPDALPKIFEPFFSTKQTGEGTGLGLSTAYGIVKQTGGFIFVDSSVGVGTSFTLYFPASSARDAAPDEVARPRMPSRIVRPDAVILLVEDEAPVRAFASRALRLRGYTVIEAGDAEEALTILEDQALVIDLFVTDVIMPGMDGPTWVRQALKDRPDTAVVFISGYAEEGRAEKQARIPNSVFLPKPFSLQQLTEVVHERLSE